jgi:hypothetical protein
MVREELGAASVTMWLLSSSLPSWKRGSERGALSSLGSILSDIVLMSEEIPQRTCVFV